LRFEIPASLGGWPKLRLDPADRPGFFWLHRIALRDADSDAVLWEWLPSQDAAEQLTRSPRHQLDIGAPNAASEALSLLMLGDDPQVELPIPPEAASSASARDCVLDVECGWPLSADYLAAAQRFNQLEGRIEALSRRILELEATARTEAPAAQTQEATSIWRSIGALFDKNRADRAEVPVTRQRVSYDPVVEIVVPVYGNLRLVQRCLHSVQASTGTAAMHITVINDASPDLAVRTWLNAFALANPEVTVIENSRNLGFVETVNLGMRLAGRRDVVLLNSDTEVANDWLDRLRAAALSHDGAGTVTPFSNNATICSYPKFCEDNPLLPGHDTASTDRLVAQVNPGKVVDIPTAVGFCMYIRRACLDAVGDFDAASFGAGYGEENDFCLRATALGWRHLHALDVFVYHEGGASFKESRFALQARALETIRRLHPGYEDLIREFVQRDPARPFRAAIDQARAPGEAPLNA
jgi:GT2 family glycosyltransferase